MAKPLETVADQAFWADCIEKELIARSAWGEKFKDLLDRPVKKTQLRLMDLPQLPCEPVDHTGKYAVKRIDYTKLHLQAIDNALGDRKDQPLIPIMYPRDPEEFALLQGDKKERLPEIRRMKDNKTENKDKYRDPEVGEKVGRVFVNKSVAEAGPDAFKSPEADSEAWRNKPINLEGMDRTRYLRARNEKAPDEKFVFPITHQQLHGWNLAEFMPPDKVKKSPFTRVQLLEVEFFRDNCIQYPPDHLDTGHVMSDLRLPPGQDTTTYGMANPDKW